MLALSQDQKYNTEPKRQVWPSQKDKEEPSIYCKTTGITDKNKAKQEWQGGHWLVSEDLRKKSDTEADFKMVKEQAKDDPKEKNSKQTERTEKCKDSVVEAWLLC